ncbi:NADPH:quinone reductase [bacterium]|jgi:NADPH:quinone reductase|nr:NADPH:quinone reductase [bacterium]
MKAAYVIEPGPASSIVIGQVDRPVPHGREILVKIHSVAINPIETYVRSGVVKMPIPTPYIIGTDFAGTVELVGPEAKRFRAGDRVWGSNQGLLGRQGVASEWAAIDEEFAYPTPAEVDDDHAAAAALVGITAHLGLFRDANLQPGEKVYVSGGTGGVGSSVLQMAKAVGAKVLTSVGSPEKEKEAFELGADQVVQYKTANIEEAVKSFAEGGIDVWWETTREPNLEMIIPLLAKRGRVILMAGRDAKPLLPLGPFYTKDCKILGFAMFNSSLEEQRTSASDIGRWLAEGKLRPKISRSFPLEEAAHAHELQEANTLRKEGTLSGKIILHM